MKRCQCCLGAGSGDPGIFSRFLHGHLYMRRMSPIQDFFGAGPDCLYPVSNI